MIDRTGITRATRVGIKARLALAGPTGSGKTYTALDLATVFSEGKGVLLVDTEHGEARTYADEFEFDEFVWVPPYDPRELITFLKKNSGQYGCVVIDSLTHFYNGEGGLLNIVDAAASRSQGNSFAGWKVATPIQNEMIDTLKQVPSHLIVTMRSKMEYILQTNSKGRQEPVKVGMAPIQREGFEYEMTFIAELDLEHRLTVTKSRYSGIADKLFRPQHQRELAEALMAWLSTAAPENVAPATSPPPESDAPVGAAEAVLFPPAAAPKTPVVTKPRPAAIDPPNPSPQHAPTTNTHWFDTLKLLARTPPEHKATILREFNLKPGLTNAELRGLPDDAGLALQSTLEILLDGVQTR